MVRTVDFRRLDKFVADNANVLGARDTIRLGPILLYVRRGQYLVNDAVQHCLVLASIDVDPDQQRRGYFKQLLAHSLALASAHQLHLYVQSIQNPYLRDFLARQQFLIIGNPLLPSAVMAPAA